MTTLNQRDRERMAHVEAAREHLRLLDAMCDLLKLHRGATNQQMHEALAKSDDNIRSQFTKLNRLNDLALIDYYRSEPGFDGVECKQ